MIILIKTYNIQLPGGDLWYFLKIHPYSLHLGAHNAVWTMPVRYICHEIHGIFFIQVKVQTWLQLANHQSLSDHLFTNSVFVANHPYLKDKFLLTRVHMGTLWYVFKFIILFETVQFTKIQCSIKYLHRIAILTTHNICCILLKKNNTHCENNDILQDWRLIRSFACSYFALSFISIHIFSHLWSLNLTIIGWIWIGSGTLKKKKKKKKKAESE